MRKYGFSLICIVPYCRIFYRVFETMVGPKNPNPYIHWLNEKKNYQRYIQNPVKHHKMKFFAKIQSRHSELFLKIGVTKE